MKQKEQHAIFSVVIKKLEEAKIVADILDSMDEVVLTIGDDDRPAAIKGVSPLKERQAYYVYDEEDEHWVVSDKPNLNTTVISFDKFVKTYVEVVLQNAIYSELQKTIEDMIVITINLG
jgi:hypothetical protein